jgi:hypothetical protein
MISAMTLPIDESSRLENLYSKMTDGELEEVAADPSSLTDLARAALQAELQRRNLQIDATVREADSGLDELEFSDLVTVRRFHNLPDALLAKGSLESAGIECYLADDNMVRIFLSTFVGGVRLLVRREDADSAQLILDEPAGTESADDDGILGES